MFAAFLTTNIFANKNEEIALNVFKLSGMDIYSEQIPYSLLSEINTYCEQSGIPPLDDVFYNKAVDTTKVIFLSGLIENFNKKELQELAGWFESDLGLKTKELENANVDEIQFDASTFPENKKHLIDNLVKVTKIEEFNETFALEIGTTIVKSITLIALKQKGKTDEEITSFHSSEKFDQLVKKNIQSTYDITTYYKTYSTLTETELKEYIKFYETELGAHYVQNTISALENISTYLFSMFGENLGSKVDKQKSKN